MPKVSHEVALAQVQLRTKHALAIERAEEAERTREPKIEEGERAGIRRAGEQIRHSPALYPWMRAYAEWMTLECMTPPKASMKLSKARSLARMPAALNQLKELEARPDFVAYVRDLESGPLERARNRFQRAFPEYVEAHGEALALARDAKDYNAIARISEPVLDRVMPKKAESGQATQVNITLSPNQLAGVSAAYVAPPMLVDEVVVEPQPE